MTSDNKVIYRFDVDFDGTASTAPIINICSTDVNSRMFIMTPKSKGQEIEFPEDINAILMLTKTSGNTTSVIGSVNCTYVNGKLVADVPSFSTGSGETVEGTVLFYERATGQIKYKLESAPFKIGLVTSSQSSGMITAADEFKALTDVATAATAMISVYNDINTSSVSSASENDLKINVDDLSVFRGTVICVRPAKNKTVFPDSCGRLYLLNKNESIHSGNAGYPICVIDPDTGDFVWGDKSHYNPYLVPMNCKSVMRLYILDRCAVWLNPPFYYCVAADSYLGENLEPYDDEDWKCKITRGPGFASVQGVCRVKSSAMFNPSSAGKRDVIGVGLPFRPVTHKRLKNAFQAYNNTSTRPAMWTCEIDKLDGSVWASSSASSSYLSGGQCFYIDIMYPVWTRTNNGYDE